MRTDGRVFRATAAAAALSLLAGFGTAQTAGAASGPFQGLAGQWSGSGTVTLANGGKENIRCKITYFIQSGGNFLQQDLRCASDSYKFELKSNVVFEAGSITGTWTEATRKVGGNVSGKAAPGEIQARVDSSAFSATLAVLTRGDKQSVTIRSQGAEVAEVAITLNRGGRSS